MKVVLKVLMAPIILTLTLFVWICSGILYCSAFIFGLAGTIIGLLGLAVLLTYSVQNGIILLVIAFLGGLLGDAGCMILLLAAVFGGTAWIYLYSYLVYIGKMK